MQLVLTSLTHERGLEIAAVIEQRNTAHWGYASDGTDRYEAIDLINSPAVNSVASVTVSQDCPLVLSLILLQSRQRLESKLT